VRAPGWWSAETGAKYRQPAGGAAVSPTTHAAGTAYGGTKLVVAALWTLRGFNRPTDIDKQTRVLAKGAHRAARNEPVYYKGITHAATTTTPLLPCYYGRCLRCPAGGVGVEAWKCGYVQGRDTQVTRVHFPVGKPRSRSCGFLSGPKALALLWHILALIIPRYYYVYYYRPYPYPSSNAYAILHPSIYDRS
jgi:hypothetical protein